MNLKEFISELRVREASVKTREELVKLDEEVRERLSIPESMENPGGELGSGARHDFSRDGSMLVQVGVRQKIDYEGIPVVTPDGVEEVFESIRRLKLRPGEHELGYKLSWDKEGFLEEDGLEGLFNSDLTLMTGFFTRDPSKNRIVGETCRNIVKATTRIGDCKLELDGEYRTRTRQLLETLRFQTATVELDSRDAERLIRECSRVYGPNSRKTKRVISALTPIDRSYVSLSEGEGISFSDRSVINVNLRLQDLREFERIIGHSLISPPSGGTARALEFSKSYGVIDQLLRKRRLRDFQRLVRTVSDMELRVDPIHPPITLSAAKELLDSEVELVRESYDNDLLFGYNSHMIRGRMVRRLAREQLGREVDRDFDELSVDDFVIRLEKYGYAPREDFGRTELDYIAKEKHLLACFLESYKQNPKVSIDKFRDSYKPDMMPLSVTADVRNFDAAKSPGIVIPSRAEVVSFGLQRNFDLRNKVSNNYLSMNAGTVANGLIVRVALDDPRILDLQNSACEMAGVSFK